MVIYCIYIMFGSNKEHSSSSPSSSSSSSSSSSFTTDESHSGYNKPVTSNGGDTLTGTDLQVHQPLKFATFGNPP